MIRFVGHDENFAAIQAASAKGKLHHGWILAGKRGLGKASFAQQIAAKLIDPNGQFQRLINSETHPDIIALKRLPKETAKDGDIVGDKAELKREITVDQVRALHATMTTRPAIGEKRAVIIDAADDLNIQAANAILKHLEEPPVGTYFFLVSHAPDRLLPTIRSRCQTLRFDPLSEAQMIQVVHDILPELSETEITALVRAGAGSPGQALEFAGLDLAELEASLTMIVMTGDPTNDIRSILANKLTLKAAQPRYEAFLRRAPQLIAEQARLQDASAVLPAVDAWHSATELAIRAVTLSLDKQSVVLEMGSLLASLQTHKQPVR